MGLNEHDLDDLIRLSTDEGAVTGALVVKPLEHPEDVTENVLRAVISGKGIRDSVIDKDALVKLVSDIRSEPTKEHTADVARGTPPVHGEDASYTLVPVLAEQLEGIRARKQSLKDGGAPKPPKAGDANDDTDFYEQSSFIIVSKGDTLAHVNEGREHEDGTDIFGKTIPARAGSPVERVLHESVELRDDKSIVAHCPGVLNAKPDTLSIDETLTVQGDVDFSTGRIRFPGDVLIRGSIRDHFHVWVAGSIVVHELVECANVDADADITFKNGMAGKGVGSLHAGRDLQAGYLESVKGVIDGDATITREITNCDLHIGGTLDASKAAVRGGSLRLTKGGTIGSLGSAQGVETIVILGSIPQLEHVMRNIERYGDMIESTLESDKKKLETFANSVRAPTAQQIEEQMGMQFQIEELEARANKLLQASRSLSDIFWNQTSTTLTIRKAVHPKVKIYFPGHLAEFERELSGECEISTDEFGSPVLTHRGTSSPLSDHARVMRDDTVLKLTPQDNAAA